jgi:2-polyprenyl-3-methyl-5-hydroxy-6-metoxy-1,4-benzoquinol methylase
MTELELADHIRRYVFYHTIRLSENVWTQGVPAICPLTDFVLRQLAKIEVKGTRVLDIGCRDGLMALEAERRGAGEVVAVDSEISVALRDFLIPHFESKVQLYALDLLELRPSRFGKFDVVIFAGGLTHVLFPVWALKLIRDVLEPGGVLMLETAVYADANQLPLMVCSGGETGSLFNIKGLTRTLETLEFEVQHVDVMPRVPAEENMGITTDRAVVTAQIR